MKTLSMKFAAVLSVLSLYVVNFPLKANAQVFAPETLRTLQICNTIMNMQDADPDNPELRIGRRECNLRAYYVNVCTTSGFEFAWCWDNKYTDQPNSQITTDDLENIIANNQ